MSDERTTDARLLAIESALMHLQHDVEQLHEALVGYRHDLEGLRRDVGLVRGHVERLEQGTEVRDPQVEKPPHY